MKILLTGANGQLGRQIFSSQNQIKVSKPFELIKTTKAEFNLLEIDKCVDFIKTNKPDLIINAAAYTAVDKAESEFNIANRINSHAINIISKTLFETGGKILHISTDYVFNGDLTTPYKPNSIRDPINCYGISKANGEKSIENILFPSQQGFILRTSWLMGPLGNNFALTMLDLMNKKENLKIIFDQIGAPTTTISLARVCWEIVSKLQNNEPIPNIMHWSDAGVSSWYDIAIAIREISLDLNLLDQFCNIEPILSSEYNTIAKRPYNSLLDCKSTEQFLGIKQTYWKDSILELLKIRKEYLNSNYLS